MVHSKQKLKNIKLVITDVDGVLTDAGIYYSKNGEFLKKFNTRDSLGMELLLEKNIKTVMLTRENSEIVKQRAKKIKIVDLFSNIKNKKSILSKIQKKYSVKINEIAYIGDDIIDLEIMKSVGFCASPNDGISQIKKISDYVCILNGGEGAFREFAELILKYKKN
jgi:YrbI family 3-deoxy-D-manno-octulosonate 8-phosphate phosphatase